MRRPWIVLVLAAASGAGCKDKDSAPAPAPVPAPSAPAEPAAKPAAPRPVPTLAPPPAQGPPQSSPEQVFATEAPDVAWKPDMERKLHERLARLSKGAPPIECHATTCLVTLTDAQVPDLDELSKLRDMAKSVLLTRPDDHTVKAYLAFDR